MKIWKLASAATALVLSTSVNAALIDNGTYTTDTISGLDWLDLTETNGFSYDDVSGQLSSGDVYDGWRYATVAEAENLFLQFGLSITSSTESASTATATVSAISNMTSYFGDIVGEQYGADYFGFYGIVDDGNDNGSHAWVGGHIKYSSDLVDIETDYANAAFGPDSNARLYSGHYLVQTSVVPIPAAVWLFGSGLIGLAGVARRKKA